MAKKEHSDIISSFVELKEFKNIDNSTMLSILEESFRKVIANIYGSDQNYDFIFNPDKGDFEIWRNRMTLQTHTLRFLCLTHARLPTTTRWAKRFRNR